MLIALTTQKEGNMNKEDKRSDLDRYYQNCPFPKPKPSKKQVLFNGYKDKPQRLCWYTNRPGAERHEVFWGINRQTSIEHKFQVDLCPELHARLHANADTWARVENKKWRMYYQSVYEMKLKREGLSDDEAREEWMALIGKNYL